MSFAEEIQVLATVDNPAKVRAVVSTEVYGAVDAAFDQFPESCESARFEFAGDNDAGEGLKLIGPAWEGVSLCRPIEEEGRHSLWRKILVLTPDKVVRSYDVFSEGASLMTTRPQQANEPVETPQIAAALKIVKQVNPWEMSDEDVVRLFHGEKTSELENPFAELDLKDVAGYIYAKKSWYAAEQRRLAAIENSVGPIPNILHVRALGALISQSLPKEEFLHSLQT